jgi:hypothetical protein
MLIRTSKKAIEEQTKYKKCLINMWCGTGKTRTFTIDLFINNIKKVIFYTILFIILNLLRNVEFFLLYFG